MGPHMGQFGHQHERVTSVIQQRPLTVLGTPRAFEFNASTAFLATENVNNNTPAETATLTNTGAVLPRKVYRSPPSGVMSFAVLLASADGHLAHDELVNAQIAVNQILPGKMGHHLSSPVGHFRVPLLRLNASAKAITSKWTTANFPHSDWFVTEGDIGPAEDFAFANNYEIVYDGTFGNGASVKGRDRTAGTDMGGVQLMEFDNGGAIALEFLVSLRLADNSGVGEALAAQILVSGS